MRIFHISSRGYILAAFLICEGIGIYLFSQAETLTGAVLLMLGFALFLKMANGATYSIVPFINKKALGSIAGIVGAGGNVGAVLAGFLFKSETITYRDAFMYISFAVAAIGLIILITRFFSTQESAGTIKHSSKQVLEVETA